MEARCLPCMDTTLAFPGQAWEQLLLKSRTDPLFKRLFLNAREVKTGGSKKFSEEEVSRDMVVGYQAERLYDLLTEEDFKSKYGLEASKSGLVFEEFLDELGRPIRALPVASGSLKMRVTSYSGILCREILHKATEQLRPSQGSDLQKLYLEDFRGCSSTPKPLRGKQPLSETELEAAVAERKAQLDAEAKELQRQLALKAAAQEAAADAAPKDDEMEPPDEPEEEEEAEFENLHDSDGPILPSHRAKLQKEAEKNKKWKSKGASTKKKAEAKKRQKEQQKKGSGAAVRSTQARVSASVRQLGSGSVGAPGGIGALAGDTCSTASGRARSGASGHCKWQEVLSLPRILAGDSLVGRVYDCQRAVEKLTSVAKTPSELTELNALKNLHEIAQLCKELDSGLT